MNNAPAARPARRPFDAVLGHSLRRLAIVFALGLASNGWSARASAQMASRATTLASTSLLASLDSIVREQMRQHDVHGAVIAVVHRGRVIANRGYGIVDSSGTPVNADVTTFGVSSMSKVFTAAAVLQLVDLGQLRLHDAVSQHVRDVDLGNGNSRPVTIADLLTHSAGFDEAGIGIAARTPDAVVPLGSYLQRAMPPRVRAAGDVTSYSNHGFALAGLVVERAARRSFAEQMRVSIFAPLGMTHTGFEQPLPDSLERVRALPLRRRADGWALVPRIYFNDAPASAMYTTGADMGRFMLAFLDSAGSLRAVLADSSAAKMRTPQFTNHAAVRGLTFGFRERSDSQVRSVEQGGDWQDYSSDLLLAPDVGLGLFLAFSNDGADRAAQILWRQLLQGIAAVADAQAASSSRASLTGDVELARFEGTYRLNRYSRNTVARLGVLTGAIHEVGVRQDGQQLAGAGTVLRPVSAGVFVRDDTHSLIAFRLPEAGGVATHLFFENSPYAAYERVPWYGDRRVHLGAFVACAAVFVIGLVTRRRRTSRTQGEEWRANVHRRVATFSAVGGLTLLVLTGALLATADPWEFQYGVPARVRAVLLLAVPVAALGAATVVTTMLVLTAREGTMWSRVRCVADAAASILFVALLWYWRIL